MTDKDRKNNAIPENKPVSHSTERQEQADPPLTELRGFTDPNEDLEPTLTDGTKAPDKAERENAENAQKADN